MENVVPIAQLNTFIKEVISQVNAGLAATRAKGIIVEMPDAIQMSVVVVKEWQPESLQIVGTRQNSETGLQGGTTTETQNGTGGETTTSEEQGTRSDNGEDVHKQTTTMEATFIT